MCVAQQCAEGRSSRRPRRRSIEGQGARPRGPRRCHGRQRCARRAPRRCERLYTRRLRPQG
eukprot:8937244-Alexandrium_andersonii.AAC.1